MKRDRTLEARRERYRERIQNRVAQANGAAGPFDQGSTALPSMVGLGPLQQDTVAAQMYLQDWQARKIIDIPIDDMLREGWEYDGLSTEAGEALREREDALDLMGAFDSAMKIERLLGGAAIFLGVTEPGNDDPSKPLISGRLEWVNVIPRTRLSVTAWQNDALKPDYGKPASYRVNGKEVHQSRLIVFDGSPLSRTPDSTLNPPHLSRGDGFGVSQLLSIYDDMVRATGTRQAAYQLVNRASVIIAEMELAGAEDSGLQAIKDVINQISLYRGAAIDRDPMQQGSAISTMSASFGSVPELVITYLQVLAAASDIPATRFLGQAPGGLNATGESDLENYYGRLESRQKRRLGPQVLRVLKFIDPAITGVTFPPLWSLSAKEEAQVRQIDANIISTLEAAGTISGEEAAAELRHRKVLSAPGVALPLGDPEAVADELADPAAALVATQAALEAAGGDPAQ